MTTHGGNKYLYLEQRLSLHLEWDFTDGEHQMSIDYVALKAELDAGHPVTGAYDANDQLAADELNLANIDEDNVTTGFDCQIATDPDEFQAQSIADQQLWSTLCGWDQVDFNNGIARSTAQGMWQGAGGAATRPALVALSKNTVNRTSQINVGRPIITKEQVANARAQP
jgi:hypothetical protein